MKEFIKIVRFISSTYKKNLLYINPCTLNFHSECPFCYKRAIIKTLIPSATLLLPKYLPNKLRNIKQLPINNGFPNYIVDTEIKHFINKTEQHNIDNILNHKQSINLYYKNQFHSDYKIDEDILKNHIQKMFSLRSYQKSKTSFTTTNLKPPT